MINIKRLKSIPLFRSLSGKELNKIQEIVFIKKLKRGDILFKRGEKRENFYLILKGRLEIYRIFGEEEERFAVFSPGEFCCEEAFSKPESIHTKDGKALENLELLTIEGKKFIKLAKKESELTNKILSEILTILAERLHHADNKLITLYRIGSVLSQRASIEEAAPQILQAILEVIKAKKALFVLFHRLKHQIIIVGAIGFAGKDILPATILPLENDLVLGEIFKTGETFLVTGESFTKKMKGVSYATNSMIGVPIKIHSRVIGAILLLDKKGENFNINNKILLEIIAKQVAGIVHLAEVLELEKAQEELKRIYIRPY